VKFSIPPSTGRPWTFSRVATDLAIILVAVPSALEWLVPTPRVGCVVRPVSLVASIGLLILSFRVSWLVLKPINDAFERQLARWSKPISRPKPHPLEDF
jgi:hypothetical protein